VIDVSFKSISADSQITLLAVGGQGGSAGQPGPGSPGGAGGLEGGLQEDSAQARGGPDAPEQLDGEAKKVHLGSLAHLQEFRWFLAHSVTARWECLAIRSLNEAANGRELRLGAHGKPKSIP
jgi:hypothetical protein